VRDLVPANAVTAEAEAASRKLLAMMNATDPAEPLLAARAKGYELAARMQLAVPKVADLSRESAATKTRYGFDDPITAPFARNCLLARRLVAAGVRFVQLFSGGPIAGNPRSSWDAHENVKENHTAEAARIDRPIAALLDDLAHTGLLADTLLVFTTEFGRTPFAQSAAGSVGPGRDHNKYGFSGWLAGPGLRPGFAFGATDDIGWKAVEQPVTWPDFHATLLQLLGLDHEALTYYHNGIRRRLTNVHGHVIRGVLA
jgi:uncharacterized protein (DUF1501 family)